MATLTIRNLDENLKQKLREQAGSRGVSMEQQARSLLARNAVRPREKSKHPPTVEEILDFGRRLGKVDFDQKSLTDDLWSFAEDD